MNRWSVILTCVLCGFFAEADTTLVFGFDNNTEPNGIRYNDIEQSITFSGAVSGADQTDFNVLDNIDGTVNFSIGAVGDLVSFSGTISSVGGKLSMGASGAGVDAVGTDSPYLDQESEAVIFTFSHDVYLISMNYYDPEDGQQSVLINDSEVAGSPFDNDFAGSFFVKAGDALKFGYIENGGDSYGIDDFQITVVPEPVAVSLIGVGGLMLFLLRRITRS